MIVPVVSFRLAAERVGVLGPQVEAGDAQDLRKVETVEMAPPLAQGRKIWPTWLLSSTALSQYACTGCNGKGSVRVMSNPASELLRSDGSLFPK